MGGDDALHPGERLEAALGLTGLRRLGAKALDERVHARDLALLARRHRPLAREPLRALALEGRVVARVELDLAPLEMGDVVDDAVEELTVV